MKKILLSALCVALLAACDNTSQEYDQYYEQSYKDSVAALPPQQRPTNTQTKIGSDAAVNDVTEAPATDTTATAEPVPARPAGESYELGAKLIAGSDCTVCHQNEQKVVGPSYREVAEKYPFTDKNVDYLAQKIKKGGAGVWGQVPMPPHPDLSDKDAQEMAKYVLSLKK